MSLHGLHLLIVEDHEFQRQALARMLGRLGAASVLEAPGATEALALLEAAERIDVIITDLDMPGMDGMAFIRRLAEERSTARLVITSTHGRSMLETVRTMAAAYGVALLGTLAKPVTPAKLQALMAGFEPAVRRAAPPPAPAEPPFAPEEILAGLARGQFEAFFEPKVRLATRQVVGFEALARWRHPQHGIVGPARFVGALERAGAIDELTWSIAHAAATACAAWRASGMNVTVSVNLSAASLGDALLADRLTRSVRLAGLAPKHVTLEVTESVSMTNLGPGLENLSRLRMRGFGLSIDDYGTGYSTLQQLSRIAFSELKVDRSLVLDALRSPASRVILRSSLAMARRLQIASVAEGVETDEAWSLVLNLGCDLAQGYFIARPMEASAVAAWYRQWTAMPAA